MYSLFLKIHVRNVMECSKSHTQQKYCMPKITIQDIQITLPICMKTLYQVLHLKILGMAIYLCYIICKYFNKTFNLIFSTFKTGCKHTFEDIKYQEFTLRFFNHIKQGMPSHPFPKWYLCLHRRLFLQPAFE